MLAHIYRADGREEDIELDYCYSDEEAAIAVCEDGDFGSGDRAIVCVTRWDKHTEAVQAPHGSCCGKRQ